MEGKFVAKQILGYKTISKDAEEITNLCLKVTDLTHKLEQYAKDKKVDEFLGSFSHLETYSIRLNSLM